MSKALIIDLALSQVQSEAHVRCSYRNHPDNKGFDSLLEMIRFALICRKCRSAPCIRACPQEALEKEPDSNGGSGLLKRATMRCTGCRTCTMACPFGTVYSDLVPYLSSVCDLCRDRLADDEKPLCVTTCEDGSIDYKEISGRKNLREVQDGIMVRVRGGDTWEPILQTKENSKR